MYTVSLETISYVFEEDCSGTLLYVCTDKNIIIPYSIHIIILIQMETLLEHRHIFFTSIYRIII